VPYGAVLFNDLSGKKKVMKFSFWQSSWGKKNSPHLAVLSCSCTHLPEAVWGWVPFRGAGICKQTHGYPCCIDYAQSL